MSFRTKDLTSFARGDTWTLKFTITDTNSQPIDITGLTFWLTLKQNADDPDPGDAQVSTVAGSPDSNQGIVYVTFPASVTNGLAVGTYNYDLQQVDSSVSPAQINTLLIGKVKVAKDITRTT